MDNTFVCPERPTKKARGSDNNTTTKLWERGTYNGERKLAEDNVNLYLGAPIKKSRIQAIEDGDYDSEPTNLW